MNSAEVVGGLYDALGTGLNTVTSTAFTGAGKLFTAVFPILAVFFALTFGKQIIYWLKGVIGAIKGE